MSQFAYPLQITIQCWPNGWKIKLYIMNMFHALPTYFKGCRKKASFLYLWLLQYESIIPIKAIPERRPVFSRASQWFGNLCPNLPSQACLFSCFTVSLYKASHKMGLGTLWAKNGPVLWDTPEVSQNETTGVLRMLTRPWELERLTQGSRTDVPWMPAVLLYDPIPLGSCQHHSGHILTRNPALLWEIALVWKAHFH